MKSKLRVLFCLGVATVVAACGGSGDHADLNVGEVAQAVAPPGSNAAFIPGTFPTSFFPGERRAVSITMRNTGAASPANDWVTTNPAYWLLTKGGGWGWSLTVVPTTIPVGSVGTFNFVVQAPTTAIPFQAQMYATSYFGELVNLAPTISTSTVPDWGCELVSGVPTTMTPGEVQTITVTVRNSGSQTWSPAGNFALAGRDNPVNFWGTTYTYLTAPVAPNATTPITFSIRAPSTPGTYTFQREMKTFNQAPGDFRNSGFCIDTSITVGGTPVLDSQVVSTNFPTPMNQGDIANATVTMRNTGTETWTAGSTYVLYSANSPTNLWGTVSQNTPTTTAMGSTVTFTIPIHALASPGTYSQVWQMRKLSGTNASFFGQATNVPVTIAAGTPNYGAAVVTQTIPNPMTAGKTYTFSIEMQNTGTTSWVGTDISLFSTNSPFALWGPTSQTLGASETITAGQSRTFNLAVTAPATPGTYTSSWRMRSATAGYFGATATTSGLVVTLCGNGVVDAGETCDDSNVTSGDGCSSTCQTEQTQTVVDLASQSSSRGLLGTGQGMQAGAVVTGDVTGDGIAEVFVSQFQPPTQVGAPARAGAGSVYGFSGGSGFLSGSTTTNPAGSTLQIAGADAADGLAVATSGRMFIGEVTGDSTADLVVSASAADGPSNGRTNCGEVYVFAGGASLMSAGFVDLLTSTLPRAHITGKNAGDGLGVIALGDVTGDGHPDLALGSPVGAGTIYIVSGGASLSGEIDLAGTPPAGVTVTTIVGATSSDALGTIAAIGDLNGDGTGDLLAGVGNAAPGGRTRAGAAYARFGPITSNVDFSQAAGSASGPSAVWLGQNAFDALGLTVAIGNVTGTSQAEAVIGSSQYRRPGGSIQGGAILIFSNVTAGTTYDLSVATTQTATILGAEQGDICGTALGLGDMNADGFQDMIFGCSATDGPDNTRNSAGEVDVVLGAATLPATYDLLTTPSRLVMHGGAAGWVFAHYQSTLGVGDLDGDGKADFCAGTTLGGGLPNQGRVDCLVSPF